MKPFKGKVPYILEAKPLTGFFKIKNSLYTDNGSLYTVQKIQEKTGMRWIMRALHEGAQ